jgi:hypothetical protein
MSVIGHTTNTTAADEPSHSTAHTNNNNNDNDNDNIAESKNTEADAFFASSDSESESESESEGEGKSKGQADVNKSEKKGSTKKLDRHMRRLLMNVDKECKLSVLTPCWFSSKLEHASSSSSSAAAAAAAAAPQKPDKNCSKDAFREYRDYFVKKLTVLQDSINLMVAQGQYTQVCSD